jgi:hypothetical protein
MIFGTIYNFGCVWAQQQKKRPSISVLALACTWSSVTQLSRKNKMPFTWSHLENNIFVCFFMMDVI